MLTQVRQLHPNSKIIHIGADEALHLAEDEACKKRLNTSLHRSVDRLKLDHVSRIVKFAKEQLNFEVVMIWNDMFGETSVELLQEYNMGELVLPVVWGYIPDVTRPGYFPNGMFERYSKVFKEFLFAGAFKGANGEAEQLIDVHRYMENLLSYEKLFHQNETLLHGHISGIILTGWQRYAHHKQLCELLPVGIPSLINEALYLEQWGDKSSRVEKNNPQFHVEPDFNGLMNYLKCPVNSDGTFHKLNPVNFNGVQFHPTLESYIAQCSFLGADLFREVESLRFLFWKVKVSGNLTQEVSDELHVARERILPILLNYFFEDTVQEWNNQIIQQFTKVLPTS